MHRRVNTEDIIDYSTRVPKDDFKFEQTEDIEYRNGSLLHSSGHTEYNFTQNHREENIQDEHSFTDIFSARGSYTLDLLRCYSLPYITRQMRSMNEAEDVQEENLKAKVDPGKPHLMYAYGDIFNN